PRSRQPAQGLRRAARAAHDLPDRARRHGGRALPRARHGRAIVRAHRQGREAGLMKQLKKKKYLKLLEPLQVKLTEMQRWLQNDGRRLVVLFEGRDTAGKGGAINCFTEVLNPRSCKVVALPKPSEREHSPRYFQRYVEHL